LGETHEAKVAPSTRHSNVLPCFEDENENDALLLAVLGSGGE
jgi:hypothetical protein